MALKRRERFLELALVAYDGDVELKTQRARARLGRSNPGYGGMGCQLQLFLGEAMLRRKNSHAAKTGNRFLQQGEVLPADLRLHDLDTGDVAARSCHVCCEPSRDKIPGRRRDDGSGARHALYTRYHGAIRHDENISAQSHVARQNVQG